MIPAYEAGNGCKLINLSAGISNEDFLNCGAQHKKTYQCISTVNR